MGFGVACSVGFASCKTFGKQPKHPCFDIAPMRVVSRWCRCIVQRLCATDFKRPCLVRAAAPHSAPARTPGVYAQRLCTMQSQPSIHSLSRGKGVFGQGCRNKDTPSFKHGCLQVVEQSRCRTHRQQTTTIAQMQSQQSIHSLSRERGLGIGIEILNCFIKIDFIKN